MDVERRIAEIRALMKPLQDEFGIKSMTIAERAQAIQQHKQQQQQISAQLGNKRPPPKWKV